MGKPKRYETIEEYKTVWHQQNRERMLIKMKEFRLSPSGKYSQQKAHAKRRGIPWEFTFETWWKVWEESGKWGNRGRSGYVMCRFNDEGPYSPNNVRIDTVQSNINDRKIKKENKNSN